MAKMYNYVMGTYDDVDNPPSYADYIPQDETAQRVYALGVELGQTPATAALMVLVGVLDRFKDDPNTNGK